MDLALYQPDIPQNTGAVIRTAACFGAPVHIIEPCGFPFSAKGLARAGLDYIEKANLKRHDSFEDFEAWRKNSGKRLVLLSTKAKTSYLDFRFSAHDILLLGRESSGVPKEIFGICDAVLRIPLKPGLRSLNVGVAGAIVLAEALRQTGGPGPDI